VLDSPVPQLCPYQHTRLIRRLIIGPDEGHRTNDRILLSSDRFIRQSLGDKGMNILSIAFGSCHLLRWNSPICNSSFAYMALPVGSVKRKVRNRSFRAVIQDICTFSRIGELENILHQFVVARMLPNDQLAVDS
jgi:hypothetical protein